MRILLLLLFTASPLDAARTHLDEGKLDDVLFDLDGKQFSGDEKPKAAALLGEAALKSYAKKDDFLALQFSQMARKLNAAEEKALEAEARANFRQQQFEAAEAAADAWVRAAPKNASARLLRAQLAEAAGEWQVVVDQLGAVKLTGADEAAAAALRGKAQKEIAEASAARSEVKGLEMKLLEAQRRAASSPSASRAVASTGVVLYSAAWCGYCKKERAWLKAKGVNFTERDIEKDNGAAEELARKASAAGVRPRGVPVTDVRGTLVEGFDEPRLTALLGR